MRKSNWRDDLYIYRKGVPTPPEKKDIQEYIDLYCAEKDDKYFSWFLYCYEETLNERVREIVQEYAMYGHFADLKQAFVFGMLKALQNYDLGFSVPFLIFKEHYAINEITEYVTEMRHGFTTGSVSETKTARKAMALYAKYDYKSDDETIAKIAKELDKSPKLTSEIIRCSFDNMNFVDFYRRFDYDTEDKGTEDVTSDPLSDAGRVFLKRWREDGVLGAYSKLDYRERMMIAGRLAFCPDCFGVLVPWVDCDGEPTVKFREKKNYVELAAEHTLSSPDTAHRICEGGYEKMLIDLAVNEYIDVVELRLKKKTDDLVIYEYCADHNNDWGEIRYVFGEDDYEVTRYVYADVKGVNVFFAHAGEWVASHATTTFCPKRKLIVANKL